MIIYYVITERQKFHNFIQITSHALRPRREKLGW